MTPVSALERNAMAAAEIPPLPGKEPKRNLTLQQTETLKEYCEAYDLSSDQIWFDGTDNYPIFDFDALFTIANMLTDIPSIMVEPGDVDSVIGLVTASCEVKLSDGKIRVVFGSAMTGEEMPDSGVIEDLRQALNVAQARALRKGLRVVSFDPVKAHETKKHGEELKLEVKDPRQQELAEAHMLGEELGLISGADKAAWRQQIDLYFPGKESASQLGTAELAQFISYLRSIKTARLRGREIAITNT